MSFYVVEAQLTEVGLRPLQVARQIGLEDPVFVTNQWSRYAAVPGHGEAGETFRVLEAETNDIDALERAIEKDSGTVAAIFTMCDYNLAAVSLLCERFSLPGLASSAAHLCVNKLSSREALAARSIPCPAFVNPRSDDELVQAAKEIGFPCVVKPMTDSASTDVRLCFSLEEARAAFDAIVAHPENARGVPRPAGALVEEYVLGYEVSVESWYDQDAGKHEVVGVTDKVITGAPAFAETSDTFPSVLPDDITDGVAEVTVAALDAVGHRFGAAHTELRVAPAGPKVIEINGRVGGGDISELVRLSTGIDMLEAAVAAAAGRGAGLPAPTLSRGAAWRAIHAPRNGHLSGIDGVCLAAATPGVVDVSLHVPIGAEVRTLASNHEFIGHVLTVARTAGEAARIADAAVNHIVAHVD